MNKVTFTNLTERRVQQADAFALQFNEFEWKDLCSYQAFITLIDRGLDTGNFLPALLRAEEILEKDRFRRPRQAIRPNKARRSRREVDNY